MVDEFFARRLFKDRAFGNDKSSGDDKIRAVLAPHYVVRRDLAAVDRFLPIEPHITVALTDHLGLYLEYREEWKKGTWGVVGNMSEAGAEAMEQ